MTVHLARTVLFAACLLAWQPAHACRCAASDPAQTARESDAVYLAKAVSIRLATATPRHNEWAAYAMELRPRKVFKGQPPGLLTLEYGSMYHDRMPVDPDGASGSDDFLLNSCDWNAGHRIGDVFLVLDGREAPLRLGACSESVVPHPTLAQLSAVEASLAARPAPGTAAGIDGQTRPFARHGSAPGTPLGEDEAIAIAKAEASRRGIDLARYKAPDTSFRDGVWQVHFEDAGQEAALGGHFMVSDDARTDTLFYGPGR